MSLALGKCKTVGDEDLSPGGVPVGMGLGALSELDEELDEELDDELDELDELDWEVLL